MEDSIEHTQYEPVNSSPRASDLFQAEENEAELGNDASTTVNESHESSSEFIQAGGNEAEREKDASTASLLELRERMHAQNAKHEQSGILVTSAEWFFSWPTIFIMVGMFLLALACAIGHFVLFNWLDGKPAGAYPEIDVTRLCVHSKYCTNSKNDQTYITTASVMLAGGFSTFVRISLGVAFTQYLWRIVRTQALKISVIEALFNIRSNPFRLFHVGVWKHAFVLVLMAIMWYLIPIAASFPPGALIVRSISPDAIIPTTIPTYNSSDIGDGTLEGAMNASLITWGQSVTPMNNTNWVELWHASFNTIPLPLVNLAAVTSLAGQPIAIPTPCGPNCTYTYDFEGPSFNCSSTVRNRNLSIPLVATKAADLTYFEPIYSGRWQFFDGSELLPEVPILPEYVKPVLNITISNFVETPVSWSAADDNNAIALVSDTNLTCFPYRSLYTVTNKYTNGVQNINYSISQIERLPRLDGYAHGVYARASGNVSQDLFNLTALQQTILNNTALNQELLDVASDASNGESLNLTALIQGLVNLTTFPQDLFNHTALNDTTSWFPPDEYMEHIQWTEEVLLWYRNIQMMAMATGIAALFNGTVSSIPQAGSPDNLNATAGINVTALSYPYWDSAALQFSGTGGPFLPFTSISNQFHRWYQDDVLNDYGGILPDGNSISFTISEEKINKIVGDYVISMAPAFTGAWSQTLNVTQFPSYNVYSFSRRSHLFAPYAACLGLVFLTLILGIYSLYMNGVPANDGGFIQVLSTTTGSEALRAAAAGNCLGGDGKLPKDLKDMRVKFGELVAFQTEVNGVLVRRAGFGREDEVMPLTRGERYGFVGEKR